MSYKIKISKEAIISFSISDVDVLNMKILSPVDKLDENVSISESLCASSRILYPKLAKKCKTDMFLPRRMQLKLAEEKSLIVKNAPTPKPAPEVKVSNDLVFI